MRFLDFIERMESPACAYQRFCAGGGRLMSMATGPQIWILLATQTGIHKATLDRYCVALAAAGVIRRGRRGRGPKAEVELSAVEIALGAPGRAVLVDCWGGAVGFGIRGALPAECWGGCGVTTVSEGGMQMTR